MIDALEIGYAIKDRRTELKLTQAQLAEMAGISKRCLWSLELGQNPGVQLDKLTAVFEVLGLNLTISKTDATKPSPYTAADDAVHTPPTSGKTSTGSIDAFAILTGASR